MKKIFNVDQEFIRYHRMLAKELGLNLGDVLHVEVNPKVDKKMAKVASDDGHTNPDDPRKPKKD